MKPDGSWFKEPVDVRPPPPASGYSNPGCYLKSLRDCSGKLSREHYISKAILHALCDEQVRSQLEVTGFPWLHPGRAVDLSPKALAAKVLCTRHNEALSRLDDQAMRFFLSVRDLRKPPKTSRHLVLFNGNDIERWLLKTMLGTLAAELGQVAPGQRIQNVGIGDGLVRLLMDPNEWNPHLGLGVYFLFGDDMTMVERGQIAFRPVVDRNRNEIYGSELLFRGLELLLGTSPKIRQYSRIRTSIHRPFGFFSGEQEPRRELWLTWEDGRPHRVVHVTFTGERNSVPEDGFTTD